MERQAVTTFTSHVHTKPVSEMKEVSSQELLKIKNARDSVNAAPVTLK